MALLDPKGRSITYLRLSITDRCNYRCTYCLPADGFEHVEREKLLSLEELARVARVFASLGVRSVRLTGGEPMVRNGVVRLVRLLANIEGIEDISMTTNGERLRDLAGPLRDAGLRRLNVSIDTLDPDRHRELSRGGILQHVMDGIDAAREAGFERIKTNTVVIRGINDQEAEAICDWAWERALVPRFIELMPLGEAGRQYGAGAVVPTRELVSRLAHRLDTSGVGDGGVGSGPAIYYPARDGEGTAGFIGAVTENFCSTCNRVRVTCQGELRGCLARPEGSNLREVLRSGASDQAIADRIVTTVSVRKEGHEFWAGSGDTSGLVIMTGIGG